VHGDKYSVGIHSSCCRTAPQHCIFTQQKKIESHDDKNFSPNMESALAQQLDIRRASCNCHISVDAH
jgi:hypothetical protein